MIKKQFYVDNSKFLQALIDYKKLCRAAKKANKPKPNIPDYIGECFLKIGQHLAFKGNFINYTFRDDMIGDGIENCLTYIENFNPSKSKNPFAYFTQIIYFAFLRRIQRENKQLYIKYKVIQKSDAFADAVTQSHDENTYDNAYVKFLQKNMGHVITEFEDRAKKKSKNLKKKKSLKGLENFFDWGDQISSGDPNYEDEDVRNVLKSIV